MNFLNPEHHHNRDTWISGCFISGAEAVLLDSLMQIASDSCEECGLKQECHVTLLGLCANRYRILAATALMIVKAREG